MGLPWVSPHSRHQGLFSFPFLLCFLPFLSFPFVSVARGQRTCACRVSHAHLGPRNPPQSLLPSRSHPTTAAQTPPRDPRLRSHAILPASGPLVPDVILPAAHLLWLKTPQISQHAAMQTLPNNSSCCRELQVVGVAAGALAWPGQNPQAVPTKFS